MESKQEGSVNSGRMKRKLPKVDEGMGAQDNKGTHVISDSIFGGTRSYTLRQRKLKISSKGDRKNMTRRDYYEKKRMKMAADPESLALYRKKDREGAKDRRAAWSEERRKQEAEKSKLRMRKYREKLKSDDETQSVKVLPRNSVKVLTRHLREKQREQWRNQKQRQRAKMTGQAKIHHLEKRREKYHSIKPKRRLDAWENTPEKQEQQTGIIKVESMIECCTPETKHSLKTIDIISTHRTSKIEDDPNLAYSDCENDNNCRWTDPNLNDSDYPLDVIKHEAA